MPKFISEFASVIPKNQSEQIFDLLSAERERGNIRTIEEYTNKLKELTATIVSTDPKPSLQLFSAIFDNIIDSEGFNLTKQTTINDLKTLFAEIDNLCKILVLHQNLVRNTILDATKQQIANLEADILLNEFFIENRFFGFNTGHINSFNNETIFKTPRDSTLGHVLFVDPQEAVILNASNDLVVDIAAQRLILPKETSQLIKFEDVFRIFDSIATSTDLDVEFPGANIFNMIDATKNTFHVSSVLKDERPTEGVQFKFQFDFSGGRYVNHLTLEPASEFPFKIVELEYLNENTQWVSLGLPIFELASNQTIYFEPITARAFRLSALQETSVNVQYHYKDERDVVAWERIINDKVGIRESLEADEVLTQLQQVIRTAQLQQITGVNEEVPILNVNKHEYIVGFDNVTAGFNTYRSGGVYVSSKISPVTPGQMAIIVDEDNLLNTAGDNTSSFEYDIIKINYDASGKRIDTETFPIIPLEQAQVNHEKLFLRGNLGNTGRTRFFPELIDENNLSLSLGTDVKVFRDYVELSTGDYSLTVGFDGAKKVLDITILGAGVASVYTVSYTQAKDIPIVSRGTAFITDTNLIEFDIKRPHAEGEKVATSDIYLNIIMRNSSGNNLVTPALMEYRLLAGSVEEDKFELENGI